MKTKRRTKRLVVVADDFGWTRGVNEGILDSYNDGLVTEISYMLDASASDHALEVINKHKISNVGIHLGLIGWSKNKRFMNRNDYNKLFKEKSDSEIETLAITELEKFETLLGHKPTHIIPQYGIHGNLKLLKPLITYAKQFNIPIRIPYTALGGSEPYSNFAAEKELERSGAKTTDHLFGHVVGYDLVTIKQNFISDLMKVADGESAEILLHPGYFDKDILGLTSLTYERSRDVALCFDTDFKNQIIKLGFKIISYSQLI